VHEKKPGAFEPQKGWGSLSPLTGRSGVEIIRLRATNATTLTGELQKKNRRRGLGKKFGRVRYCVKKEEDRAHKNLKRRGQ